MRRLEGEGDMRRWEGGECEMKRGGKVKEGGEGEQSDDLSVERLSHTLFWCHLVC